MANKAELREESRTLKGVIAKWLDTSRVEVKKIKYAQREHKQTLRHISSLKKQLETLKRRIKSAK